METVAWRQGRTLRAVAAEDLDQLCAALAEQKENSRCSHWQRSGS